MWRCPVAEKYVNWPDGWPGLKDPTTKLHKDYYSIFVDRSHFEELKNLLAHNSVVRIDGKLMCSEVRSVLPYEEVWIKSRPFG